MHDQKNRYVTASEVLMQVEQHKTNDYVAIPTFAKQKMMQGFLQVD